MNKELQAFIDRGQRKHGDKFSTSGLSMKFAPYFHGDRIKVRRVWGEDEVEEITGTVSATTGWKPSFLLMRRSNAMGSSDLLNDNYQIVAVKRGREYVPLARSR